MRPALAIEELTKLKVEAEDAGLFRQPSGLESWKPRVRMIFVRSLGEANHLVASFDEIRYSPGIAWSGMDRSYFDSARQGGVKEVVGLIEAAIYELGLIGGDEPVDEHAFDHELWAHVKTEVEDEEWARWQARRRSLSRTTSGRGRETRRIGMATT
jgi:hypothetical protein